jgi:hypothetical protein
MKEAKKAAGAAGKGGRAKGDKPAAEKPAALAALAELIDAAAVHKAEESDAATKEAALAKVLSLVPEARRTGVFRVFKMTDPTLRQAVRDAIKQSVKKKPEPTSGTAAS